MPDHRRPPITLVSAVRGFWNPGTPTGLPPARRPHPRPRHPLLARAAPGPHRRDHHQRHLERIREDLQELHVGTFEGPAGTFRQRTELTTAQRDILSKLASTRATRSSNSGRHRHVLTSTNITAWTHACPGGFRRPRRSNRSFRVQHQHQLRNPGFRMIGRVRLLLLGHPEVSSIARWADRSTSISNSQDVHSVSDTHRFGVRAGRCRRCPGPHQRATPRPGAGTPTSHAADVDVLGLHPGQRHADHEIVVVCQDVGGWHPSVGMSAFSLLLRRLQVGSDPPRAHLTHPIPLGY
jgi:hypothetical protein